ncbi:orotidine-5'-phosphate decarboxylase [Fundicoccus culcitae]|uniref:Orotidine 5'-phosphate decarboxylase n=1 Tax=Fundicoccus culcitae TaxID=2969821 RepID=A0ABY5P3A1_9LACT|nr:orotidine-5'-phosphate decarboxylase [Fundicoccus culcitae]UUX33188.1 orotidine-5'-phosphate decarboxylase [Fundicoccus culcitae]
MDKNLPIVALDIQHQEAVREFLSAFEGEKLNLKVGMELFYSEGAPLIKELKASGHDIFLDLKLHDIPTTVERAMEVLTLLEVDMLTIHASGGVEMMKAAIRGLEAGTKKTGKKPLLVAVTQLTSTTISQLRDEQKIAVTMKESVTHYAELAMQAGIEGVVCSPQEVSTLKESSNNQLITVTPGIRLNKENRHDQKRIATPFEAGEVGSDFIVVGRPITESKTPVAIYNEIRSQWEAGRAAYKERN